MLGVCSCASGSRTFAHSLRTKEDSCSPATGQLLTGLRTVSNGQLPIGQLLAGQLLTGHRRVAYRVFALWTVAHRRSSHFLSTKADTCLPDMCPLHSCSPDNCQLTVCPPSRHISRIFAPDSQLLTGQLIVICSFAHLLSTKADI